VLGEIIVLDADQFITLAERLTGTPVKSVEETDRKILGRLLAEDARSIGHSQLNELLLLVNKDRMERAFFDYFFGAGCTVGTLHVGVRRFQELAMLCFGNFIYAYRTLTRCPSTHALEAALGEWARRPEEVQAEFAARSPKLVDIELIPRGDTPLVGYLSASEVVAEGGRWAFLQAHLPGPDVRPEAEWPTYEGSLGAAAEAGEQLALRTMVANYRKRFPGAALAQFAA
jgi:hypothetical protein